MRRAPWRASADKELGCRNSGRWWASLEAAARTVLAQLSRA